jgi:SnoaL-like domain
MTGPSEWLDRAVISDVLVRFARALDEKDWVGYAALYAADGTLRTPRGGHRGRAGLAEYVEHDLGGYPATHHVSAGHAIDIDGDTATVRSSLHATHLRSADPGDFWTVGGWYDTTLRRVGAGWEITSVVINPVWSVDSHGTAR